MITISVAALVVIVLGVICLACFVSMVMSGGDIHQAINYSKALIVSSALLIIASAYLIGHST